MQQCTASRVGTRSLVLLSAVCALGLTSCGDDSTPSWWKNLWGSSETSAPPAAEPAAAEPATAAASKADAMQAQLLDYMIYSVGDLASRQASSPSAEVRSQWIEEVRDMRNKLEEYYATLGTDAATLPKRVKLGAFLADATRNLTAYEKALAEYGAVLSDWEQLPEELRESLEWRRIRSAIANGIGSCLLKQRKPKEALPHYEKALEIDLGTFNKLAPADGAPLPKGADLSAELESAAADVISSYRCLGECQLAAEDPEEARDTYKHGQDIVLRMKHLPPPASIQYIRLLSALGDLENFCGQPAQAAAAWGNAANLAKRLRQVAPSPAVQAQAVRYMRQLEGSLKTVIKQLQESQPAADPANAAEQPQQ